MTSANLKISLTDALLTLLGAIMLWIVTVMSELTVTVARIQEREIARDEAISKLEKYHEPSNTNYPYLPDRSSSVGDSKPNTGS